ncbi:MAG TPA: galactokinase family protein, partial [Niallia sp.]|nr:galactokinase family protein [Niallia sp.]
MPNELLNKFIEVFQTNEENSRTFFAPGRVNLIGEHTDYNGGHVFPCALTIGTTAIVKKREDRLIRFYSTNFEQLGVIEVSLDNLRNEKAHDWANYPKGVVVNLEQHGYKVETGFDVLYAGE